MALADSTLLLFSLLTGCVLSIPMSVIVQRIPCWIENRARLASLHVLGKTAQKTAVATHKPPPYPITLTAGLGACTALLIFCVGSSLGITSDAAWVMVFCSVLLILAAIDSRTYLLPDMLTLPLLWLGLVYHLLTAPAFLSEAVLGAMGGYVLLWSIYWGFKLIMGKEGMGYGDFKLLAAIGAWVGVSQLSTVLLISAGIGTLVGLVLIATSPKRWKGRPLPFGPFLATGGIISILAGDRLAIILPVIFI